MKTEEINGKTLETWTPEEVAQGLKDETIVLIDVRTPAEFMFESIEDALLAPMSHISKKALPAGLGKHVVLYCGSGMRSRKAAEICLSKKFEKMAHLDGGFANWKQSGQPYLGTDMSTGAPTVKTG